MEFPFKYIDDNLIFTDNNEVWAYYKIEGFSYDFLDFNQKKEPFLNQFSFLSSVGLDLHMLSVPHPTDIEGILRATIEEIKLKDYPLKENGIRFFMETIKELSKNTEENESSEYYDYIGVQLDPAKNKNISPNPVLELVSKTKSIFDSLNSPIYKTTLLNPDTDILESVISSFKVQARTIEL